MQNQAPYFKPKQGRNLEGPELGPIFRIYDQSQRVQVLLYITDFGLKVPSIWVLWGLSISYMGTWTSTFHMGTLGRKYLM